MRPTSFILLAAACLAIKALAAEPGQTSMADKLKSCNAEASSKDLHGDDRKNFLRDCLKPSAETAHQPASAGKPGDIIPPDKGVVERAKSSVKEQLKDPESAQFKIKAAAGPIVCGTVNAKNSYGGYVGATRFMYNGKTNNATLGPSGGAVRDDVDQTGAMVLSTICDDMEKEASENGGKIRRKF